MSAVTTAAADDAEERQRGWRLAFLPDGRLHQPSRTGHGGAEQ